MRQGRRVRLSAEQRSDMWRRWEAMMGTGQTALISKGAGVR
jgi:hypothetical protein